MAAVIQAGIWKEVCMCVWPGGRLLGPDQFLTLRVPRVHPTGGVLESVPAPSPSLPLSLSFSLSPVSVSASASVVQMLR